MSDAEKVAHEVEHDGSIDIEINWWWGGFVFVGAIFLWFWAASSWYRVDCALKIQRACDLIQAEYVERKKP